MTNELPHALLQCSDCSTTFRVTLKKGRVPSKPLPCPKCKRPITVTEADVVQPGAKTATPPTGSGELRQTKPGDLLRKTKLVEVNEANVSALMDPPTAEIDVDAAPEEQDDAPPSDGPPKFGIIQRKKITGRAARKPEDVSATASSPGVHVVKGDGRGARDNVFGKRVANSQALGRIATKQVRLSGPPPSIDPSDPDLPQPAHEEHDHPAFEPAPDPVVAEPSPDEGPADLPRAAAPAKSKVGLPLGVPLSAPVADAGVEPSEGSGLDLPRAASASRSTVGVPLGIPLSAPIADPGPASGVSDLPQSAAPVASKVGLPGVPLGVPSAATGLPKKIDFSKLRRAMEKLDRESEAVDDSEASSPAEDFDLDLVFDEVLSEASSQIETGSLIAMGDGGEPDAASSPEPEVPESESSEEIASDPEGEEPLTLIEPSEPWAAPALAVPSDDEPSDGYELGDAEVPVRPTDPDRGGQRGIFVGILLLLIVCALAWWLQ